jgi:hypothetical protein
MNATTLLIAEIADRVARSLVADLIAQRLETIDIRVIRGVLAKETVIDAFDYGAARVVEASTVDRIVDRCWGATGRKPPPAEYPIFQFPSSEVGDNLRGSRSLQSIVSCERPVSARLFGGLRNP